MFYSSYPSSTLHNHYSVPPSHQNFAHISSPALFFSPALYWTMPLPSASQSHVPTIRGTPPPFSIQPLESNNVPHTSPFVQYRSPLLSPLQFPQSFSSPIMNNFNSPHIHIQNMPTPHNSVLFSSHNEPTLQPAQQPLFLDSPATTIQKRTSSIAHSPSSSQDHHLPSPVNHLPLQVNQFSSTKDHHSISSSENHHFSIHTKTLSEITLPSTKDIPILTGKHNWRPWHMAVWTLIDCSNLLSHVHKDMLPGALYDPDLEPAFPPVITCDSPQHKKDRYSGWWSYDKVAAYILTSCLSPTVLGTVPIANLQLGQQRSA